MNRINRMNRMNRINYCVTMNRCVRHFIPLVISFFIFLFISLPAQGRVTYNYTTLIFLNYEELHPIVKNSIRESRAHRYPEEDDKAIAPLKNTLSLLFSRPDNDGLLRKLTPTLISELQGLGVFEEVISDLIKNAESEIEDKTLEPKIRTTALLRLNNLLLTIRPLTLENVQLAKEVCRIADSNIKIPKAVQKHSHLTTMFNNTKPSHLAKKIMLWYAKKKGKEVQAIKSKGIKSKGCPYSKKT